MKCEGRIRLSVVWFVIMEYIDILRSQIMYISQEISRRVFAA